MTHAASFPRLAGFTLLELLVVLAVLSLAVGLVVLQPGVVSGQRALEAEAVRVLAPFRRLCDEAVLTGRPWGLWLGVERWRVLTRLEGRWQWPAGPQDTGPLPAEARWQVEVNGHRLLREEAPEDEPLVPQLVCMPDGLRTPVLLTWLDEQGGTLLRIRLDADGRNHWSWR